MYDAVKLLLASLPFLGLALLGMKINLKKVNRSRQILMPVLSVLVCMWLLGRIDALCQDILEYIRELPQKLMSLSPQIADFAEKLLQSVNWSYWMVYIACPVMLIWYYLIKAVLLLLLSRLFSGNGFIAANLKGLFYKEETDLNFWSIKEKYAQLRLYYKVFFFGAVIIATLMMTVCKPLMDTDILAAPFYPMFGVITVGELYFALDGLRRKEYYNTILGEDEDAAHVVNYSLMRKFLRSAFPEHLMQEDTVIQYSDASGISVTDVIKELEKDENPDISLYGVYLSQVHRAGLRLNTDYIYSVESMLRGRSVLFNNPFYHDLVPYIFYPLNRVLMRHKKVMVVLGRHRTEEDVKAWLEDGVASVTKAPQMWRIGVLGDSDQELDIGIVTRSDVHNCILHQKKKAFFSQVEYVILLEPSKLISTAQIGLNSIIKYCRSDEKNIVCCSFDKNCDGLVDALSHILMTDIQEVSATNRSNGVCSYMCWDYDQMYWQHRLFPNISRYLGIGTELSLAALKNQVETTFWYGGETYPVADQLWIDRQYYYDLMRYAGLPARQEEVSERFRFRPSFWDAKMRPYQYMTVEDESNNMFEMVRAFSTRSTCQGFVNVISGDYMLRDYMADNASIFMADPKAIPCIVADYARTARNVTIRLLLMFASGPVSEEDILKEFAMMGRTIRNVREALWCEIHRCYTPCSVSIDERSVLLKELEMCDPQTGERFVFDESMIYTERRYSVAKNRYETLYCIDDRNFLRLVVGELRSAAYIAEDEKGGRYFLGAELYGHIFQRHLPGQFFVFDGKYYEMCTLADDGQVIVRRAADHIHGRKYYRQFRTYTIGSHFPAERTGGERRMDDIDVALEYADITVNTSAYLEMDTASDYVGAKRVEISGIPERSYRRKQMLRLEFPALDSYEIYTLAFLLNEVFASLFAENQSFIVAAAIPPGEEDSSEPDDHREDPLTYRLVDDSAEKWCICIIEDSQTDLGLLVAVERNLRRILGMVYDYLDWHEWKTEESQQPEPEEQPREIPEEQPDEKKKKKGFFGRLIDKIKSKFKKKKPVQEDAHEAGPEHTPEEGAVPVSEDAPETAVDSPEDMPESTPEDVPDVAEESTLADSADAPETEDGTDVDDRIDIEAEEEEATRAKAFTGKRTPYYVKNFLLLGGTKTPSILHVPELRRHLEKAGYAKNPLTQARTGRFDSYDWDQYDPHRAGTHFCDFCGVELVGTEYEILADGRERCMSCGRTAVKTAEEFTEIFKEVMRNMEAFFGIQFKCGIHVEMTTAQKIQRRINEKFVPTAGFDARAVGLAVSDSAGYKILIESGAPRVSSIMTIAHELTHIWQYLNWDESHIHKKYGHSKRKEIYEGMAKWVEIQYALLINEKDAAKRMEISTMRRQDEYGRGFLLYQEKYSFSEGNAISKPTPFMDKDNPL